MIVVDTSALLAIALHEPRASECLRVLEQEPRSVISAGTLAEALIVGAGKGLHAQVLGLVDDLGLEIIALTPAAARQMGTIYQRWGRGLNPTALNFGDCFAYELAERLGCPLLYVGNDFAKTDVASAL